MPVSLEKRGQSSGDLVAAFLAQGGTVKKVGMGETAGITNRSWELMIRGLSEQVETDEELGARLAARKTLGDHEDRWIRLNGEVLR